MALRAVQPQAVEKRLKMFVYGSAGVGKTRAALQFPNSYVIDCEKGTENYDKIITAAGSAVFQTTDMNELLAEVRSLGTERHDYRTLVIDPITTIYNDLLEKAEFKVGSEFGRHYGEANKVMKRLANMLYGLDLNVIVTAHAKAEYGQNFSKIGYTFEGWKQLDYWFDLVIEIQKKGKKRVGKVVKTRIDTFPDEDVFEWGYDEIANRWGRSVIERDAAPAAEGAEDDATPGDAEQFRITLRELFESRGFTPEEMRTAATGIAKGYGVNAVMDLGPDQRQQVLAAVAAGKADKFKGEPAAV